MSTNKAMERLFFVIGNPRSGTTLFRVMLNSHRDITIPPECGFALWLYERFRNADFLSLETLESFIVELSKAKKFETWHLSVSELNEFIISQHPRTYQDVVWLIYQFYSLKHRGRVTQLIGDKNNFYIHYLNELEQFSPNSKRVCIVRDGRDVACSYKNLSQKKIDSTYAPNLASDIEKIASEWVENNTLIKNEVANGAHLIRYEDLLLNPVSELSKVCEFLGLEFDPAMLDYYQTEAKQQSEPTEFLQWKSKILEKPDTQNIGKFKSILSKQEISVFDEVAQHLLDEFGYETI
jgi:hypothetical protein